MLLSRYEEALGTISGMPTSDAPSERRTNCIKRQKGFISASIRTVGRSTTTAGAAQIVTLPEEVQSVASGLSNAKHAVLNLDGDMFLRSDSPKNPADVNGDGVVNILDLDVGGTGVRVERGRCGRERGWGD